MKDILKNMTGEELIEASRDAKDAEERKAYTSEVFKRKSSKYKKNNKSHSGGLTYLPFADLKLDEGGV
jgi:hypothetical protein